MGATPLVFLGTPEPAALVLEALLEAGHQVVHVVTGADKRRGRGGATSPSAVKRAAMERSVSVSHDLSWFDGSLPPGLRGVVVAYGRIIPASVLAKVPMWNVHFSLLPRWRGAAPVARAILSGDTRTGVCIMEMDEGLDTGPVLGSADTPIGPQDTTSGLTERLARLGAGLLLDCLADPAPRAVPQSGEVCYAHKITAEEARIDWADPTEVIDRRVRALRAFTTAEGRRLLVLAVSACDTDGHLPTAPGQVLDDGCVATGTGFVRLVRVQEEGRPTRDGAEWVRGWRSSRRRLGDV